MNGTLKLKGLAINILHWNEDDNMNRVTLHELQSGLVLKRLTLGFLWAFCLFTGIFSCITSVQTVVVNGDLKQLFMLGIGVVFCLIPYCFRREAYHHILLSYQCFPILNRHLTVTDQKHLLPDSEEFHSIKELQPLHRKFTKWDRMESRHWLRINGYFISKELLIGMDIQNTRANLKPYRKSTYLHFIYANGENLEIRLEDALHKAEQNNYRRYFAEHCKTTSHIYSRKLLDSIHQTCCEFVDDYAVTNNYQSRQETLAAIAMGDSGLKEHIQTKYNHYWDREKKSMDELKARYGDLLEESK